MQHYNHSMPTCNPFFTLLLMRYILWASVCEQLLITLILYMGFLNILFQIYSALSLIITPRKLSSKILHHTVQCSYGDLCLFSHKSISQVRHWCQLEFKFLPKVLSGVGVRAMCSTLKLIRVKLDKVCVCVHGAGFVHKRISILEEAWGFGAIEENL